MSRRLQEDQWVPVLPWYTWLSSRSMHDWSRAAMGGACHAARARSALGWSACRECVLAAVFRLTRLVRCQHVLSPCTRCACLPRA
eukprot:9186939-Alexandrium_andersonii.AAC.1